MCLRGIVMSHDILVTDHRLVLEIRYVFTGWCMHSYHEGLSVFLSQQDKSITADLTRLLVSSCKNDFKRNIIQKREVQVIKYDGTKPRLSIFAFSLLFIYHVNVFQVFMPYKLLFIFQLQFTFGWVLLLVCQVLNEA